MSIDLSNLNNALKDAISGMLPAARYVAEILAAEIVTSKNDNLQVVYDLAINMDSKDHKPTVKKFSQLTESGMEYFVEEMNILKIFVADMSDLPVVLKSVIGAIVEVEITYRDNYKYPVPRFTKLIYKPPAFKAAN